MNQGRIARYRKTAWLRYGLAVLAGVVGLGVLAWFLVSDARSGPSEADVAAILQTQLGGDTTIATTNRNSFALAAANLNNQERRIFEVGDSFFTQNWVTAPASTEARDGLGPTFNAQSCSSCHTLDGRAQPPADNDDPERGLLFRLSIPGVDPVTGGPLPDPVYGGQLQDRGILTVSPEGRFLINYREMPGAYEDGTSVHAAAAGLFFRRTCLRPHASRAADFTPDRAGRIRRGIAGSHTGVRHPRPR